MSRRPLKVHDRQVKAYYGRLDGENDIIYAWGKDVGKRRGGNTLHYLLGSKRPTLAITPEEVAKSLDGRFFYGPSVLEALDAAGYDLTTLRLSIELKKEAAAA